MSEKQSSPARFLGGRATRLEMYAIAIAILVVGFGSVGGAIVVASNSGGSNSGTSETTEAVSSLETTSPTQTPGTETGQQVESPPPSLNGFSGAESSAVQRLARERIDAEIAAQQQAERDAWARANPIARLDSVEIVGYSCGSQGDDSITDWAEREASGSKGVVTYRLSYEIFGPLSTSSPSFVDFIYGGLYAPTNIPTSVGYHSVTVTASTYQNGWPGSQTTANGQVRFTAEEPLRSIDFKRTLPQVTCS
jgi:hypothetical protein